MIRFNLIIFIMLIMLYKISFGQTGSSRNIKIEQTEAIDAVAISKADKRLANRRILFLLPSIVSIFYIVIIWLPKKPIR